jgi:hypothetical protein
MLLPIHTISGIQRSFLVRWIEIQAPHTPNELGHVVENSLFIRPFLANPAQWFASQPPSSSNRPKKENPACRSSQGDIDGEREKESEELLLLMIQPRSKAWFAIPPHKMPNS